MLEFKTVWQQVVFVKCSMAQSHLKLCKQRDSRTLQSLLWIPRFSDRCTCSKIQQKHYDQCCRDPVGDTEDDFPVWFFISLTLL